MDKVFLSFSFRKEDRELSAAVRSTIESHDLHVVTGEDLGGGGLNDEIKNRIVSCDALVSLFTQSEKIPDSDEYRPSTFVRDEFFFAMDKINCIAIIESKVRTDGMVEAQKKEHIQLDSNLPFDNFAKLSRTIALWKRRTGRIVQVQLDLPQDQVDVILQQNDPTCQVRLIEGRKRKDWLDAPIIPENFGGCSTYVEGIKSDTLFEIQTKINGSTWKSRCSGMTPLVKLVKLGDNQ